MGSQHPACLSCMVHLALAQLQTADRHDQCGDCRRSGVGQACAPATRAWCTLCVPAVCCQACTCACLGDLTLQPQWAHLAQGPAAPGRCRWRQTAHGATGRAAWRAQNGYFHDQEASIHHIVLNALVETQPDADCFGWLDLLEDRLCLTGIGRQASYHCLLRPLCQ